MSNNRLSHKLQEDLGHTDYISSLCWFSKPIWTGHPTANGAKLQAQKDAHFLTINTTEPEVLRVQYAEGDDPAVNEPHIETPPRRVQTHPARLLRPVLVASDDVPHVDEVGTEQLDPVVVAIQDEDVSEWIGSEADGGVHASRPGPIGAAVGARRASHW